jgi:hydrogenase maturation protease
MGGIEPDSTRNGGNTGEAVIHLICLGNALHSDHGFGTALHHTLSRLDWPQGIKVLDGLGRNAGLPLFEHCERAIVLEALPPCCGAPGQVVRLADIDYPQAPETMAVGTGPLLAAVRRIIQPAPRVELLGPVSVSRAAYCPGLTPLVAAAVETVAAMLVKELGGRRRNRRRLSA